ncbi:hypothetical protein GXW84_39310 [Rhodococcus sp. IEGM 248]|nr:hypothetical protein [Rhodococcus sp. IEGM 248]
MVTGVPFRGEVREIPACPSTGAVFVDGRTYVGHAGFGLEPFRDVEIGAGRFVVATVSEDSFGHRTGDHSGRRRVSFT